MCLFYCRDEGDIPLGDVTIMTDCSPQYEDIQNFMPPCPLPPETKEDGCVHLEPCPAYMSATEEPGYVDMESCPTHMSATEEAGYIDMGPCPTYMSSTEEAGGVDLQPCSAYAYSVQEFTTK